MAYSPSNVGMTGPPGKEEAAEQNALLPRTLFSDDVKPGDTITLKVSAIFGDEVEVALQSSSAKEPTETEMPPMMSADEEFEAAAEMA